MTPRQAAAIERLRIELAQEFHVGTRVTNCVLHMGVNWDARPTDCELCATDIRNQLAFAIRVNEWLNERVEACRTILAAVERGKAETAE